MFVTRDVFSDDSDEVVGCLEGESGLETCYTCTLEMLDWGFEGLWIGMVGGMEGYPITTT